MRTVLRFTLLALLIPVLYAGSAVVYFPAILWHGAIAPRGSALMRIRAVEAAAAGRDWELRYQWTPLEAVSPHLLRAVLAAEDTRFYEHHGFDVEQIRAAWEANRAGGSTMRGASTITQQTVKNLYLSPSRNVLRKAREAILTAWMELWLPKDRILELYVNVVELGPGTFGAGAASAHYFGRRPDGLSRDQAALLAATLPAPLSRNPGAMTSGLRRRQRMILSRMHRWYEGPSLAQEEASGNVTAEEIPPAPEVVEAEPLELEAVPDPTGAGVEVDFDAGDPLPEADPPGDPQKDDALAPTAGDGAPESL